MTDGRTQTMRLRACPMCGSTNLEADDPGPGEWTCRDCGEVSLDEELVSEPVDE